MTLDARKDDLRRHAGEARRAAARAAGPDAGRALAEAFLAAAIDAPAAAVVSGYWPMADEIDVRPLMARLAAEKGHALALPIVLGRGQALIFRRWTPGAVLDAGTFGTYHPPPEEPEVAPGVLLVPLLAFDRAGYRIGWGGGFYDRTLASLRGAGPVLAVGVAYAAQEVDTVPRSRYDQRLDWIVTEEGAMKFGPEQA